MHEGKLELIFPHVIHEAVPQSELVKTLLISSGQWFGRPNQLKSDCHSIELVHALSPCAHKCGIDVFENYAFVIVAEQVLRKRKLSKFVHFIQNKGILSIAII